MLTLGLIFPNEEYDWIKPIVIQSEKDTKDIIVCVDFWGLNIACVHDPFLSPFSDEVLDQIVGKEAYSLTNGL